MASDRHTNYFVHTLLRARDWQHRPEFDQVCDWWRGGGRGVCALVGMGGAGKTAIADRFQNELQTGGSRSRETSGEHTNGPNSYESGYDDIPPPHSVFVYSFYDDDKPENFFRHLQIWLEGTSTPEKDKSPTQLMFDIQQHQGLIILDGLERVQESGARGGFGRLTSPSLRDLLNHIAGGSARELSVLVTSRFPLTDLRDSQPRFFHTIPVEEISVAAGVALLRERGVRGTDMQLASIVEHCGRHALTVDLAGGYIKEYGHGDPATPLNLGTAEELQAEAEQEPDDDKRAVLKQGIRFARIAQRYREAMLSSDEAALALLERICLFRLGVDCETLADIFTGPEAEKVSGRPLASLDADQLQKKLDWLVRMRVVETSRQSSLRDGGSYGPSGECVYTVHPAVREGFLQSLSQGDTQTCHEAVRKGLEVSLGDAPSTSPSDQATLDRLEEIIHHTLRAGRVVEAWSIYQTRLGGCHNVIAKLCDYSRASRITHSILHDPVASCPLTNHDFIVLYSDYGYSCLKLGVLSGAIKALSFGFTLCQTSNDPNIKTLGSNLADAQRSEGRLKDAIETLKIVWSHASDFSSQLGALVQVAGVELLCGSVVRTIDVADFPDTESTEFAEFAKKNLPRTIKAPDGVVQVGKWQELIGTLEERYPNGHATLASALLSSVDCCVRNGDYLTAESNISQASSWGVEHDAKQVLCGASLARAHVGLARIASCTDPVSAAEASAVEDAIRQGLKIARDCGYGLYHIDLLLERARLHLLRGDAGAALDDIEVALGDPSGGGGIPANEETGQVELLAANHEQCGYAWAIPAGLQLRAEALLLQAAREVIAVGWAVPTDQNTLDPIDVEAVGTAHPTIGQLIHDAKRFLNEALDRWHDLRDPEPTEDNNFKLDGKEYNYRASETHHVLVQLEDGILTRYPLNEGEQSNKQSHVDKQPTMTATTSPRVFISYTHDSNEHANKVLQLANRLRGDGIESHIDQYVQNPSEGWPLWMDHEIEVADFVLVVFTERYATKAKQPKRSGGRFESVLILQDLYEGGMSNDKFVPVVFNNIDAEHILKWLKPVNYYSVDANDGYELLRRRLLNDPAIVPPPVAIPVKRGPTNP